ncbi:SDR family NAD(P)-dependent oxidoreductase [Aliidiomarina haloalkalitolerans]|uniref:Short-chain dehydrogenase n=1 Tax=Aliidiomarina haloalkalitolerans TaxID=859059 RepID=A0A432VRG6_9GAMM|nr:SDR family NAD(P)-dependent oxidoreductase [Aliidiomarina haloalkalitolerans]RUO18883.1 short-chain dehydrogenase [Aliidiomarina haloalkalitolerans]
MGSKTSLQEAARGNLVAVFGAGGGLGRAIVQELLTRSADTFVLAVSRQAQPNDVTDERVHWVQLAVSEKGSEAAILTAYQTLLAEWQAQNLELSGVVSTIGWLHGAGPNGEDWQPERRIEQLSAEQLQAYFFTNATLPILLLQALKPLLPKNKPAYVAQLGAKVGSISDNHLGGWYGYRASKAALNMLFRTAAIEFKRTHKQLTLAVIHPGTTDTELSKPFQQRLPADKLYSAQLSAQRILQVIADLTPENSGSFYFWDGEKIPY